MTNITAANQLKLWKIYKAINRDHVFYFIPTKVIKHPDYSSINLEYIPDPVKNTANNISLVWLFMNYKVEEVDWE